MNIESRRYAATHEWISADGTVGISEHAQRMLTEVVFVDLPEVGRVVARGEAMAMLESVKAAVEVYAPVSGVIMEVNLALSADPGLLNRDPLGLGWLLKMGLSDEAERNALQTEVEYVRAYPPDD